MGGAVDINMANITIICPHCGKPIEVEASLDLKGGIKTTCLRCLREVVIEEGQIKEPITPVFTRWQKIKRWIGKLLP